MEETNTKCVKMSKVVLCGRLAKQILSLRVAIATHVRVLMSLKHTSNFVLSCCDRKSANGPVVSQNDVQRSVAVVEMVFTILWMQDIEKKT